MVIGLKRIEEDYVREKDWLVHENANVNLAYSSFVGYLLDKILKNEDILGEIIPSVYVKMHFSGDIHIHKLPHSLFIPYCVGWSYSKLLRIGLRTPTINTRPAKHLDTAVSHLISFFFLASQEWTGAQAISALDLLLAPFVRSDNLAFSDVKQTMQRMVYELNYPSRLGFQSPFTNVTLLLDTVPEALEWNAIVAGKTIGILGEYIDESLILTRALLQQYLEGDADSKPFTFPIVTMMFTKYFDWYGKRWGELSDLLFHVIAKRGSIYILNGHATNVDALYAMCCRLTIDLREITREKLAIKQMLEGLTDLSEELKKSKRARGIWALPDATGSIGVVTINLPRIAILTQDQEDFFDDLYDKIRVAREILRILRKRYEKTLKAGLMPLTKIYLGHFYNHFSTIGLIGLPEAVMNLFENPQLWFNATKNELKDAVSLMRQIVKFVRKLCEEFEEKDNVMYNVEEVPGESTAYRLAKLDLNLMRKEKILAYIPIVNNTPFYSNSIVPYYADLSIAERINYESEVQGEFSGGVMMHIFLGEMPDLKALRKFVEKIVKNTKIVYFSITPTLTFCDKCKWQGTGIYKKCPKCGSENLDIWSRIVGYYRPLRNWNVGRRAEFLSRIHFTSGWQTHQIKRPKI